MSDAMKPESNPSPRRPWDFACLFALRTTCGTASVTNVK
jgi:hypothetical protein